MALRYDDYVDVCERLARERDLKVTMYESGKGALYAGGGAFIGSLLGGPIGLALGGSVGACYSAIKSRNNYKSLIVVISEMDEDQKRDLALSVMNVLQNVRVDNGIQLLTLVLQNSSIEEAVLKAIANFVKNELSMILAS